MVGVQVPVKFAVVRFGITSQMSAEPTYYYQFQAEYAEFCIYGSNSDDQSTLTFQSNLVPLQ